LLPHDKQQERLVGGLTGKLIVGQSGGCTQVINGNLRGVIETARRSRAITAVWGMRHGIEGVLASQIIDLDAEDPATFRAIGGVPAAALGSCRRKITTAEAQLVVRGFQQNDVRFCIYIGGNDSADTSHRIAQAAGELGWELRVVAVPKTIDNDLPLTHHCPGYGSAGRFVACVTADTGMETESMCTHEPVKIIEVMGRNTGWLACAAALAKHSEGDAPQIVWPPEIAFNHRRFLALVGHWLKKLDYCVVVVAETLRDSRGRPVAAGGGESGSDPFGHARITGAAAYLCGLVKERFGVRARWDKPGTIQRMSSAHVSPVDLREARACGRWAVRFALKGRGDCMVIMKQKAGRDYQMVFDTVPIHKVANKEKPLPASFFDRKKMLPTAAFRRYALPLIGPGLPRHVRLRGKRARIRR
jgi:6-phosphofructokinase 1